MITHDTYGTQLFQLRFKVFPELSGKVENERERLNTVLKCLVRYTFFKTVSRQLVRPLGLNCALKRSNFERIHLYSFKRIHLYTAEKEQNNDTKVIEDQTYCITPAQAFTLA
jgi:hypothetical protein